MAISESGGAGGSKGVPIGGPAHSVSPKGAKKKGLTGSKATKPFFAKPKGKGRKGKK